MCQNDLDKALRAIRAHCLECCGGSRNLVEKCMSVDCHLYPYRCVGAVSKDTDQPEIIKGQISMFEGA